MHLKKHKNLYKTLLFITLLGVIVWVFNPLFTPSHMQTLLGFYEQPTDSVETIFLGTSVVFRSLIPTQLYQEYGICSYNLATATQPMPASYYWLIEAHAYHPQSLETVVLDVSALRFEAKQSFYELAFQTMKFSTNKLQAVYDTATTLDDFLGSFLPAYAYHDRWTELTGADFTFFESHDESERGFTYSTTQYIDTANAMEMALPNLVVTDPTGSDAFTDEGLLYLQKIIDYCDQNDLSLILIKTPREFWSDASHEAIVSLADENGIDFIDFNYDPYVTVLAWDPAVDQYDGAHANYYGATKITSWMGAYLTEHYDLTDVRGLEGYAFMDEQAQSFDRSAITASLNQISDPCEYVQMLQSEEDYTLFLLTSGEATTALTDEQRDRFASMGLTELSTLRGETSYLAVLENGEVRYEISSTDALTYEGKTMNNQSYTLRSNGDAKGAFSSCNIGWLNYSTVNTGLRIVVYDQQLGKVMDQMLFATHESATRDAPDVSTALSESLAKGIAVEDLPDNQQQLYAYRQRLLDYLASYTEEPYLGAYAQ